MKVKGSKFSEWHVAPTPPRSWSLDLTFLPGTVPTYATRLLYNRDIRTVGMARKYITGADEQLSNPSLLPGIDDATKLVCAHIKKKSNIGIYGDFDTDGITGSAVLAFMLRDFGIPHTVYLPHREQDGHGISMKAIQTLLKRNINLLITVDTGIGANEELEYAVKSGVDVVITDHHNLPDLLPAVQAIVNHQLLPNGSEHGHYLSGSGTTLKLAQAVYRELGAELNEDLTALAAIGTIADRVPLRGENRAIVKLGMDALMTTANRGLVTLMQKTVPSKPGLNPYSEEAISYYVSPVLNAPGRLDSAYPSLNLLLATEQEPAVKLADSIVQANKQRRKLSQAALKSVEEQIAKQNNNGVVFLDGGDYPLGILGVLASRVVDTTSRPVVVYRETDGYIRASARSVRGFNIYDALNGCDVPFDRFGGHAFAAGFKVKNNLLEKVRDSLLESSRWLQLSGNGVGTGPTLEADCVVDISLLSVGDWNFVNTMAPFGVGNPEPVFVARGVRQTSVQKVGTTGNHLRMEVVQNGRRYTGVGFYLPVHDAMSPLMDIAFHLKTDNWHNATRRELRILDFKGSQ